MTPNLSVSQRLHDSLRQIIQVTPPGEKLPSEPELSHRLGVSRATLREAMRTFEVQGLIHRRQGSGTYVTHPSRVIESGLEILESIETLARRIGLNVTMGMLKIESRLPSEEEAQALNIAPDHPVIHVARVILAEDRAVAYLQDVLPQEVLSPEDLAEGFTGSVLDLLLRRGEPQLTISETEINAVNAPLDVARAMGIQRGDVLLRFIAHLYTATGQVVDYSYSYFLPGVFRFHVVRRIGQTNSRKYLEV